MNEFVKALIHVQNLVDVDNQWKRAVESLHGMSNLDKALAWVHLSNTATAKGNVSLETSYKVLYERAMHDSIPAEIEKHGSRDNNEPILGMLRILTKRVHDLGHLIALGNNGDIGRSRLSDASASDVTISEGSLTIDAGPSSRPTSGSSSLHTAESTSSNFGNRNPTATDELIKKCCTDTSTSIIQLKDEFKEIHNELLQRWGDYEAESSKRANDAGVEIREIIERQFSTQDLEISKEFSDQSDAMESHEQYIEQVMDSQRIALEQTSQTMQTILSILENHDAFTRKLSGEHNVIMQGLSEITAQSRANTATLKTTVEKATGERGRAISELSSNTTKAVGEFVNALAVLRELYTSHEKQTLGMIAETRGLVDEIKQNLSKTTVSQAKSGGKKREDLLEREGNRLLQPEESPFAGSVRPNHKKEVSDDVQRKGNPFGKR
jgi:hypothetical protein